MDLRFIDRFAVTAKQSSADSKWPKPNREWNNLGWRVLILS